MQSRQMGCWLWRSVVVACNARLDAKPASELRDSAIASVCPAALQKDCLTGRLACAVASAPTCMLLTCSKLRHVWDGCLVACSSQALSTSVAGYGRNEVPPDLADDVIMVDLCTFQASRLLSCAALTEGELADIHCCSDSVAVSGMQGDSM